MDIVSYLVNLLSPAGLNSYFIHKPDGRKEDEYITFNFITNNEWYSNDEEEAEKYLVTINYMTKANKNIIPTSKKIKEVIDHDERCAGYSNKGSLYLKDTQEFITAITFTVIL